MARPPNRATESKEQAINVLPISEGSITVHVVGNSPYVFNSMAAKSMQHLLVPPKKATTEADRAARGPKHNPPEEYRNSTLRDNSQDGPTRLLISTTAFKAAMAGAALDLPDTKKTEIGRLVWVVGANVPVWGRPELFMSVVRMADTARTPDIRTRAILPEWAATVRISFVRPKLNEKSMVNLLAAAGIIRGVGDYRQEKGKGDYGRFRIVSADDPDFARIKKQGGRKAQDDGLRDYVCHDEQSARLLAYWQNPGSYLGGDDDVHAETVQ